MNLLHSFRHLFATKPLPAASSKPEETTTEFYQRLFNQVQLMCNAVPGGRAEITFDYGVIDFKMQWKPDYACPEDAQAVLVTCVNDDEDLTSQTSTLASETSQLASSKSQLASQTLTSATEKHSLKEEEEQPCKQQRLMRKLTRFLQSQYVFRYNLITEQTECAKLTEQAEAHTLTYTPVDNRTLNGIALHAFEHNVDCWDKDLKRYVESDIIQEYHPFKEYFENLPQWDGQDRITPLAERVSTDDYWVKSFHRWLLAVTAQWIGFEDNPHANAVAPILISTRQGLGKSTFCKLLLPKELSRYYTDSYDLAAPSGAETKLATFGLINLDEFDRLPVSRMPQLKNLMQMNSLNIRKAYKRSSSPLPRIASFIGTSNSRDLLTDATGSRRFICIEVQKQIDCTTPIAYAQLYAQLKHELENGTRYWFTKQEEADIQQHNKPYYKANPEEEVFFDTFELAEPHAEGAKAMTSTQIFNVLQRRNPAAMRGVTCYRFSRWLPQVACRVRTKYNNVYWVREVSCSAIRTV